VRDLKGFLSERFGIPDGFWEGLRLSVHNREAWVSTREVAELDAPVLRRGIMLARKTSDSWKLTAEGAMAIGKSARLCVIELEESEALAFLSGQNLSGEFPWPEGQVIVRWKGFPIGVGLLRGGVVKNQLRLSRRLPAKKR
jgi:16S rRNA (cytosine1407-C5)-methyltransferase